MRYTVTDRKWSGPESGSSTKSTKYSKIKEEVMKTIHYTALLTVCLMMVSNVEVVAQGLWVHSEDNQGSGAFEGWVINTDDIFVTGNFQSPIYPPQNLNARAGYGTFMSVNTGTGWLDFKSWFANPGIWSTLHSRADGYYDGQTIMTGSDKLMRFRAHCGSTFEYFMLARGGHIRVMVLERLSQNMYIVNEEWDNWQTPGYFEGWQLSGSERIVMGRFAASKVDSLYGITRDGVLLVAPTQCAGLRYYECRSHQNYSLPAWETPEKWNNSCNGWLGNWFIRSDDRFYPFDYDGDGVDELLCIGSNGWSMLLQFDEMTNQWNDIWSNGGSGWIGSWNISSNDRLVIGDFNGVPGDEILLMNAASGYAVMMRHDPGVWQVNWSNNGNGNIGGYWYLHPDDRMFIYKTMNNTPDRANIILLNATTGWYMSLGYLGIPKTAFDRNASRERILRATPSPFSTISTVECELESDSFVEIHIYSILGIKIFSLFNGWREEGKHSFIWRGTDDAGTPVGAGVYILRAVINGKGMYYKIQKTH
jgi:hypothetical protein